MKLQTIRLEGFKRFRDPFTIQDLEPGINLIAAPNGKGKSTIAEAVRVAFLERHKTASLGDSLAPWTQPGATPTVQIRFERQGKVHHLTKAFGSRKSCSLVIDGGKSLTGEEAEQHLSEMLSFRFSGKGASKAEHQGVPGLLWVQQGASGEIATQVEHAHEYISRALGDDFGELAASEGDRVIERVQDELATLQTKTGRPTGDFARCSEELARKTTLRDQLHARIRTYVQQVDRFATLQAAHAEGERLRPWEEQRRRAGEAQATLNGLAAVLGEQREVQLQLQLTRGEIERLQSALAVLDAQDQAVLDCARETTAAQERDTIARNALTQGDHALSSARSADAAARAQAAAARQAATKAAHERALQAAATRKAELEAQHRLVQGQQTELAQKQADAARLAGFAGAGKRLAPKERALAAATANLAAAATRLEYTLRAPGVSLAGEALGGTGARTLTDVAEILIEGIGSIRVLPGSKDLAQLQADCDRARNDLDQLLQAMGASTVDSARACEQELTQAQADVRRVNEVIAGLAPLGVSALQEQVSSAQGEVRQHESALRSLPASTYSGPMVSVQAAEARELVTREALRLAQEASQAAQTEAATAAEQLRLAGQRLQAARATVAATADRDGLRKKLSADLVHAAATQRIQQDRLDQLAAQVREARPDLLQSDIDRHTRSADALEAQHSRTQAEMNGLAGELKANGALGLQEEAAALDHEVARLQRQVADRTRRAAALAHLLQVLGDQRAEVARSIRAPLQKHINRYLEIQFPGASIELDEGLRPRRITRQGAFGTESGSFEELSGGEREQIGVIARLAYADLLKEAGKPTLVMLDDSLVNCDLDKLAQMKRVIYDAAPRHQIIIFTCHQELWQDVGVAPRTL